MTQDKVEPPSFVVPSLRAATPHGARAQIMFRYGARPDGSRKHSCDKRAKASLWLPPALLAAGLTFGSFAHQAHAQNGNEIPFSEVSIIIETNATDCDVGLQLFFDGEPWQHVKIEDPKSRTILSVRALWPLAGFGLTEQFNETNEPVMAELVQGFPELECDQPEFTLEQFFKLFPEGIYEYEGKTVDGPELEGEATLAHVIPAPPEIVAPLEEDGPQDPKNTVIRWERVDEPILPGLGRGPSDEVEIVGFQVIVEREDPQPLVVFTVELPADATRVRVPSRFLEPAASYKFEVLQIDVSGNQTIAEGTFETM